MSRISLVLQQPLSPLTKDKPKAQKHYVPVQFFYLNLKSLYRLFSFYMKTIVIYELRIRITEEKFRT